MRLRTIAHSRTGDKGASITISVIAYDMRDYPRLVAEVTPSLVRAQLADVVGDGEVMRYELPDIGALNFVLPRVAGDDVTRTLALDPHGKALSSALLDMEIPE